MHLFIENYGAKIEVEEGLFRISLKEEIRNISPLKIGSINVLKHCTITTKALELAALSQIPVIIYSAAGRPAAWVWSHKYQNIADLRVKQAFYSVSSEATGWITKLIKIKIGGQVQNLQWLRNRVVAQEKMLTDAITRLAELLKSLTAFRNMDEIRGVEGAASKVYWKTVAAAVDKFIFVPGRVKRGAGDPFNICLNYMYGILYGQVEASLLMAGLDPYMGLMHINRYNRPALAFDHIEPFRPWIDRLVTELCMHGLQGEGNLIEDDKGIYTLTDKGRHGLIETYFTFMEQRSYLNGRRVKNKDHLHFMSSGLVSELKNYNIP